MPRQTAKPPGTRPAPRRVQHTPRSCAAHARKTEAYVYGALPPADAVGRTRGMGRPRRQTPFGQRRSSFEAITPKAPMTIGLPIALTEPGLGAHLLFHDVRDASAQLPSWSTPTARSAAVCPSGHRDATYNVHLLLLWPRRLPVEHFL
jgi:hypothetical protein